MKRLATDEGNFFSFCNCHSVRKILWVLQFLFNSISYPLDHRNRQILSIRKLQSSLKTTFSIRINIYVNIYDIDFYSIERIFIRTGMLC